MKRNCNLELRLLTPSVSFHLSDRSDLDMNESPNKTQQLTIFYNGKVASCDATELQVKYLISCEDDNIAGERRNGGKMEQEFAVGGDEFAGVRRGDGDVDEEVAAEISGEEED
ncbi:hypothetical protein SASPL_132595 [Salvia splendens]|uniref:Tify domain-containing protein n=1 Tax=Salvia splendens TaxID=180675 RepID=A0A8X8X3V2_SALSN|nr:hypothetical protein SASPL_132595 [Salvia splendens]